MELLENLESELYQKIKCCRLDECRDILDRYSYDDFKNYIQYNPEHYNRIILKSNDLFDIMLICWNIDQESKIHDHPENGCLLKVLKGELLEDIYFNKNDVMSYVKTNVVSENNFGYREKNTMIHKIIPTQKTVSLHIYSPSNFKASYY